MTGAAVVSRRVYGSVWPGARRVAREAHAVDPISGSERAAHALFDPAVIEPIRADVSEQEWEAWLRRQVTTGRMLYYRASGGDDELRLKLLVDEPFEPLGPYRTTGEVDGAILRVDSGRVCLSGIEAVNLDEGDVSRADLSRVDVWAGTYRVHAFRAAYRIPAERIREEVAPQLERGDARYVWWAERVAPAIGALALASIVAAFVFLFSHVAWRVAAAASALAVGLVAAVIVWRLYVSPRMGRWHHARDALWTRYPPVVVVLRRLTDSEVPASFPPGRFGDAIGD